MPGSGSDRQPNRLDSSANRSGQGWTNDHAEPPAVASFAWAPCPCRAGWRENHVLRCGLCRQADLHGRSDGPQFRHCRLPPGLIGRPPRPPSLPAWRGAERVEPDPKFVPKLAIVALVDDIAGLRRILTRSRVIAVVGLSANWYRPSYFAAKYMQEHGYRIVPVNPNYADVLGEKCYPECCIHPRTCRHGRLFPQTGGNACSRA